MGFAAGFQVGQQAVENARKRDREEAMRASLSTEAAQYGVTEGAFGQGLQSNIDQIRGLQAQNPDQATQYDPAIAELQRRQGLTSPDYSVGSRATNYATFDAADQASAPLRSKGLAGVYRNYGEVDKAEALLASSFDQQRAIAQEGRAVAGELRAKDEAERQRQAFGTRQTQVGLEINKSTKELADQEGQKKADADYAALVQSGATVDTAALNKIAAAHNISPARLLDQATKDLGFSAAARDAKIKSLVSDLSTASAGGIPAMNKFLASKFDPDATDNISPEIVKTNSGYVVKYGDKILSEYGTHKSMDVFTASLQGKIKGDPLGTMKVLSDLEKNSAAIRADAAKTRLYGAQADALALKPTDWTFKQKEDYKAFQIWDREVGYRLPPAKRQEYIDAHGLTELVKGDKPNGLGSGWGAGNDGNVVNQTVTQPNQQSLPPTNAAPSVGLLTPAQIAKAQQTTQTTTAAKANVDSVAANVQAGKAREDYMLRQEANRYTPDMVKQMDPKTAFKFLKTYGRYIDPNGAVARAARMQQ